MRHPSSRLRICGAVLAAAILLGVSPIAGQSRRLLHLAGVEEMKAWFNANQGHPRVIVLLSPT
jgi:hypothetical protein